MSYEDLYPAQEAQEPGQGQGVGKPRQGQGGFDSCACPQCGYQVPHQRGVSCNTLQCPKCEVSLIGK